LPTVPEIPSPENVASPDPLVVAVALPINDAPPPVTLAVICTPPSATGALLASSNWTDGCTPNAAPLAAVPEGCVLTDSWDGGCVRLIDDDVALVTPVPEKVIV
jgi:hypothetical protein